MRTTRPCRGIFTYTVENTTNRTLTYTLAGSLKTVFEKGGNRYERRGGCHVLHLATCACRRFCLRRLTLAMRNRRVDYQEYWFAAFGLTISAYSGKISPRPAR